MLIDTQFLLRCIQTLSEAHKLLQGASPDSIQYEMYRSACVKEFEIILEQSGKLLKKAILPYMHSARAVNGLYFKDIFRHAAQFGLLSTEEVERWLEYRDNRNHVAHDYGVDFAKQTLTLLPQFIQDASRLELILKERDYD